MATGARIVSHEDEELARRIAAGERAAEEELVRRFEPGLRAIACVRVGRDAADDLVQDVLAAGLVGLRQARWRAEGPLAAYLATTLRRAILHERSARRTVAARAAVLEDAPSLEPDAHALVETVEMRDRVRAALARLPGRHATILVLHYLEGRSADAIARELRIPRGTVLSRLHHARKRLSRILNRMGVGAHSSSGRDHGR